MTPQMISAFTPSLMSPRELEQIFVQREALAQELLEKIILSATTTAKHYALLIGMRGMGKTHLVALIYYRLLAEFVRTPGLQGKLAIAWLREEEWGVDSWLDLVSRILRALAVDEPQARVLGEELRRISIAHSIRAAEESAGQLLKQAIGDRTLLLIIENLDDLFRGLGDKGQQQFRAFLQQEECCTILATTPALFDGVQSRMRPFFGFFQPHYLARLTVPEAISMLTKIANLGGQEDLAQFLQTPIGRARVRAVHHLAGGNPRVYMLFSQFITRETLDSLVQAFMKMLDDLTPYYQARMQGLSNQQRKIVELLVDRREAVMVKEIAADCYIDSKTAASQLRDLKNMGYVEATQDGRESFYELREVLMRFCLEVKKQRGQWVEIFVDFLRIWYPLVERKDESYEKGTAAAWYNRGKALSKSGRYEEAVESYKRAVLSNTDYYEAWHSRGNVELLTGDLISAIASWQTAFRNLPKNIVHLSEVVKPIQELIEEIIPRVWLFTDNSVIAQVVSIYQSAQVLPELGNALTKTLPLIVAPTISDRTADQWLAQWQTLLGHEPALAIPLRLMAVAIAYKKHPDRQKRLWLQLAKEERSILNQALGLDNKEAKDFS